MWGWLMSHSMVRPMPASQALRKKLNQAASKRKDASIAITRAGQCRRIGRKRTSGGFSDFVVSPGDGGWEEKDLGWLGCRNFFCEVGDFE